MNECVACMKKKDVPSIAKVFLKIYSGTVGGTYQFFVCTFLTNLNVSKRLCGLCFRNGGFNLQILVKTID